MGLHQDVNEEFAELIEFHAPLSLRKTFHFTDFSIILIDPANILQHPGIYIDIFLAQKDATDKILLFMSHLNAFISAQSQRKGAHNNENREIYGILPQAKLKLLSTTNFSVAYLMFITAHKFTLQCNDNYAVNKVGRRGCCNKQNKIKAFLD